MRRRHHGSERSSEDGLASGGASADYGSHDRNELFKGARAVGPDGKPRARTAAEIKAAYGHRRCFVIPLPFELADVGCTRSSVGMTLAEASASRAGKLAIARILARGDTGWMHDRNKQRRRQKSSSCFIAAVRHGPVGACVSTPCARMGSDLLRLPPAGRSGSGELY